MEPAYFIECRDLPCSDINKSGYLVPALDLNFEKVKVVMISEAPPENLNDFFYAPGEPFYLETTMQAFQDASMKVNNIQDILDLGFYLTTAIKCPISQYRNLYVNGRRCDKGL